MEYLLLGFLIAIFCLWFGRKLISLRHKAMELRQLPPGPTRWPVVGNIFQLGPSAHSCFTELARKHGPIMTIWLGSMPTIVISSMEAARHVYKFHDKAVAGRKIYDAMRGDFGTEGSLVASQYGQHSRLLRRLITTEFFVKSRLDAMGDVREKCVDDRVKFIRESGADSAIDLRKLLFLMSFNLIGNLMFSKDLLDPTSDKGKAFFDHAERVAVWAGKPNMADFWPILKRVDPQRIRRKTQFHIRKAFEIAGEFINERMVEMKNGRHVVGDENRKDYLDVLLEFRGEGVNEPTRFSLRTINVSIFEMFITGTATTTSTLEWAMAELLRNRPALEKVQEELRSRLGDSDKVKENDIENLPFLKAVIKETLRLHPPLPFMFPHKAMETFELMGFCIPKETQVLFNVWAIGRDPKTWESPLEFRPERFLGPNEIDFKGQHFTFLPFGSGRRMCPAVPLVSRTLPLALGSLLFLFDWALEDGLKPTNMDMSERLGITLKKSIPLKAIPIPYKGVLKQ